MEQSVVRISVLLGMGLVTWGQRPELGPAAPNGRPPAAPNAELVTQIGHNNLKSVSFSPDGRLVLTSGDNVSLLWETASGQEIRAFAGHAEKVNTAVFSSTGELVLTASDDGTVRLWQASTGKEIRRFEGSPRAAISSAVFSPDSLRILAGSTDGTARVWDAGSGREILRFSAAEASAAILPNAVAFSPDGHWLLTGTRKTAQLWDAATGKEIRRFEGHTLPINAVAFSPDGERVLTGSNDRSARLWSATTGGEIRRFEAQNRANSSAGILSVAFSPDAAKILTGSEDQTARVWEVATGRQVLLFPGQTSRLRLDALGQLTGLETVQGHSSAVESVAFSPDGRRLLTGESSQIARLWDAASGKQLQSYQGGLSAVELSSIAFSPDALELWTTGPHVWDLSTGKQTRQPETRAEGSDKSSYPIALSPNGEKVALVVHDQMVLADAITALPVLQFGSPSVSFSNSNIILFSPYSGSRVLTASGSFHHDEIVHIWDATTGKELVQFRGHDQELAKIGWPPNGIRAAAFSPDGAQVLSVGGDKIARLWDATTGRELMEFESRIAPKQTGADSNFRNWSTRLYLNAVGFFPDGNRVVTGGDLVQIWDKATGKEIQRLENTGLVTALAVAPDGRHILTAFGGAIRLWDATSGRQTFQSPDYSAPVNAVAFSPNGQFIASCNRDGTIQFWSLAADQLHLVATLVSFSTGGWAVVDALGRFDTDFVDTGAALHWIFSDEPFRSLPLEIFMREYYTPRLLPRILSGEKLPPLPAIGEIQNRVQPEVEIVNVEPSPGNQKRVNVTLRAASKTEKGQLSGLQDLRLFRNGQMVGYREGPLKDDVYEFKNIQLPLSGKKVVFTAYAFNSARIKSATVQRDFEYNSSGAPKPKAYLVQIGVNHYQASDCELRYAVNDAQKLHAALQSRLQARGLEVHALELISPGNIAATRTSIRDSLADIASKATPDDVFFLSFSGHGYTAPNDGQFYILPADIQGTCRKPDAQLLKNAISADDLTEWLRPIDAGEMTFILDACFSAASVEANDFKPGPMGSRGLGQLAYDKRMRILAASQSDEQAQEDSRLGQGLLSYALTQEGLVQGKADWKPKDKQITIGEWLAYAADAVPKLTTAKTNDTGRGFLVNVIRRAQIPAVFDFTKQDQFAIQK